MNHSTAKYIAKEFRDGGYPARIEGNRIYVQASKSDVEIFLRECHPSLKFRVLQVSSNQVSIE